MKFLKRLMKDLKNDAIYKRAIEKDGTISIYCDASFTLWLKDKNSSDFNIVAPHDINSRHCKLRVNRGDMVELVTDGNFSFEFIEVPPRIEIPSGEKLLELIDNKPDNIKDLVRAQVLAELSAHNALNGGESIEEFDDFSEMEDEFNDAPLAEAEVQLMQEEYEAYESSITSPATPQEPLGDTPPVEAEGGIGEAVEKDATPPTQA